MLKGWNCLIQLENFRFPPHNRLIRGAVVPGSPAILGISPLRSVTLRPPLSQSLPFSNSSNQKSTNRANSSYRNKKDVTLNELSLKFTTAIEKSFYFLANGKTRKEKKKY